MGIEAKVAPKRKRVDEHEADLTQQEQHTQDVQPMSIDMPLQQSVGNRVIAKRAKQRLNRKLKSDDRDDQLVQLDASPVLSVPKEEDTPVFWSRAVVRQADESSIFECSEYTVHSLSISPERRKTARGEEQGDHLVAWSAMYRYWNRQLRGDLTAVLGKLKSWILADETADQSLHEENRQQRAQALYFVDQMRKNKLHANQVNDYLEQAVSLFIKANQRSSFAVFGKASGGKDEGRTQIVLEQYNQFAKDGATVEAGPVILKAKQLIDVISKPLDENTLAKAVFTWYEMLIGQYPDLRTIFENHLLKEQIKGKTVSQLIATWKKHQDNNATLSEEKLKELWDVDMLEKKQMTSVLAVVDTNEDSLLPASEVNLEHLELSDKTRAKTQFITSQGSHTLAWTYERQSLMALFKNNSVEVMLDKLKQLAEHDKNSLSLGDSHLKGEYNGLNKRAEALITRITDTQNQKQSLANWIDSINRIFATYVELNQQLPTTSYKGAGSALGHGEAGANAAFKDSLDKPETYDYDKLRDQAVKYIDIGIFYYPLVKSLETFQGEGRVTRKIAKTLSKQTKAYSDVMDPDTALNDLYDKEKPVLLKIFGDFYTHMAHFHPRFNTEFRKDAAGKTRFVETVLLAPLELSDIVIGAPISIHLMDHYKSFIHGFREAVKNNAAKWSEELLKTEQDDEQSALPVKN